MQKQPFIGTAVAASKYGPIAARAGLAIAVVIAIVSAVFLIRGTINAANERAAIAQTQAAEAKASAGLWRATVKQQSQDIDAMRMTVETMNKLMVIAEKESVIRWQNTEKAIAGLQEQTQDLINRPAVAPEMEVPVARARLKQTKGYRLAN